MNEQPKLKGRRTALKSYTVYLDPKIPEDNEKIRYLEKRKKRPGFSEAIRDAMDTHIAFLADKLSVPERPATTRAEPTYHSLDEAELPETAIEATKTFLKPRR